MTHITKLTMRSRIGRISFVDKMNDGALAQLGERFAGSEEVSGSSPLCSTIHNSITKECLHKEGTPFSL